LAHAYAATAPLDVARYFRVAPRARRAIHDRPPGEIEPAAMLELK
jgi:hypothetical protein